jgi:hypothetical protein
MENDGQPLIAGAALWMGTRKKSWQWLNSGDWQGRTRGQKDIRSNSSFDSPLVVAVGGRGYLYFVEVPSNVIVKSHEATCQKVV